MRQKQGTHIWGEAIGALNQLAAADENAALRVMELELAESFDNSAAAAVDFLLFAQARDPDGVRRLLDNTSVEEADRDGADGFLPIIYLDIFHTEAASMLRALPWVQDGLEGRDASYVAQLAELSQIAPQAFQAVLREERDWLPPGQVAWEFTETLGLINSVAAVDEAAAIGIIDIPSLEPMERPDFYAVQRLAALAESNPGRLSEVLEHPAVTAGDEAHVSVSILLLDLRLRDLEASAALESIAWVQENFVEYMGNHSSPGAESLRHEAEDILDLLLLLEHEPPWGRDLFITASSKDWVQDGMMNHEREVLYDLTSRIRAKREFAERLVSGQFLDAISRLPWVQRENERYIASSVQYLIQLGALEDDRVFRAVIDRPWVQDGLSEFEAEAIRHIIWDFDGSASSVWLWRLDDINDEELIRRLLSLFLERFDPAALNALRALQWIWDGIEMNTRYAEEFYALVALLGIWDDWRAPNPTSIGQDHSDASQFQDLLSKPWMRDGIERYELHMINFLGRLPQPLALRVLPMQFPRYGGTRRR